MLFRSGSRTWEFRLSEEQQFPPLKRTPPEAKISEFAANQEVLRMLRMCALVTLLFSATWVTANRGLIVVDCGAGQSLNRTLAKMDKFEPATVRVKGTCTEYVLIDGFNDLTLKGVQGATLQQPSTNPQPNSYVLSIRASRGVTVSGLAVHSLPSIFSGIGIG